VDSFRLRTGDVVNVRVALSAALVFAVMSLSTVLIGAGVGVEANCVTLQTCGKTLLPTLKDIFLSAGYCLRAVKHDPGTYLTRLARRG
jgi:hypothetical protein